ncbi:hypothetical protein LB518_23030 [Mesorhizobium sp. BR1-1-16]|uniref:hypothetical protein n=1 Tax=Mesorhizobium sp. BR1-1-16 TaxID=2876653 RepID=UPI001CCD2563|nr:hypothetical protein [Mesorhizobium sp. BR1-1-16]MBZ9939190.1 hypothetical protein [Mesorhizobium sp. BR1-1-16]
MSTNDKSAWKLVPVVLTPEMKDAVLEAGGQTALAWGVAAWGTFLETAPEPPASPAEGVMAKPLEWQEPHPSHTFPMWVCNRRGVGAFYVIRTDGAKADGDFALYCNERHIAACSSLEAAKAAAQADFEQRVRSCLTASPISAAEHAAVVAGLETERYSRQQAESYIDGLVGEKHDAIARAETAEAALAKAKFDTARTDVAIDMLTDGEGDSVSFHSKNADFNGLPNECITISASWTDWQDRDFRADTRAECLDLAIAAMRATALIPAPSGEGESR